MLKLYVLIRDDMTPAQQAVQAGHAVAQFGLDFPDEIEDWQTDSNTLVYLSVKNIEYWDTVLTDGEVKHSVFHEPELKYLRDHWDGRYWTTKEADTAIAVAPNWTCQYLLFKDLPLALQEPEPERKRWWNR